MQPLLWQVIEHDRQHAGASSLALLAVNHVPSFAVHGVLAVEQTRYSSEWGTKKKNREE